MTDTAVVRGEERDPALALDRVIIAGDLSKLSPTDRVTYYRTVCESIGLNPFTRPFEYIVLNSRLTLYAGKSCTDQLRSLRSISIDSAERDATDPDYATWIVTGHDASGRTDMEIGSVHIAGLKGEARANAIMKALTKGKRRLTLSLAGLGWLDETEVGSVPSAQEVDVDQDTGEIRRLPLREQVAARRAAITNGDDSVAPPPESSPAGAPAVIPVERPGSTSRGKPKPAPSEGASAASSPVPSPSLDAPSEAIGASSDAGSIGPSEDAAGEASLPSPAPSVCGASVPEPDTLGIGEGGSCVLSGAHRTHRNAAGHTWPA